MSIIISRFGKRSNHFSFFKKNAVSASDIKENSNIINQNFQNVDDPADSAIEMFKYHLSIILINKKVDNQK